MLSGRHRAACPSAPYVQRKGRLGGTTSRRTGSDSHESFRRYRLRAAASLARYEDAKVGLLTHGLQYGTGCFEGIRGYWVPEEDELFLVLVRDHYERLGTSAKILTMSFSESVDELVEITVELCLRNRYRTDVYVRPFVYKAAEDVGVRLHNVPDALCDRADSVHAVSRYQPRTRRLREFLAPCRRHDGAAAREDHGTLRQLRAGQERSGSKRLRRSDPALARRPRRGRLGREHLSGAPRRALHARPFAERSRRRDAPSDHGRSRATSSVCRSSSARSIAASSTAADEVFFTGTAVGIATFRRSTAASSATARSARSPKRLAKLYQRIVTGREARYRAWLTRTYASAKISV